ncbi:MAG: sulfatase-like hydrolase/transferase [Candidatus Lokiarchaeota archaeon]|nr:sulfatase-like hydrolase/transferase [Candidatus Lokiarchaeota archaeon]
MKKNDLPNIILFVPDEMRGDCISLNGLQNPIIRTPNIDKLAQDGVAFTKCFNVNPVCGPSRCCIFTGQYVHSNAHRSLYQLLKPYEENLFRFLKRKGYEVIWIGRNDLFEKKTEKKSFTKHFGIFKMLLKKFLPDIIRINFFKNLFKRKTIRNLISLLKDKKSLMRKYSFLEFPFVKNFIKKHIKLNPFTMDNKFRKSFYFGKRTTKQGYDIDSLLIKHTLKYLDSKPKKPFCLYIALNFPHPPYTVEEPYFSLYDRDKIPDPIPPQSEDKPEFMRLMRKRYNLEKLSISDFKEIKATYYGMISRVDNQFGQVIEKLKEIGRYENSAIFFFADHGDYTGDYGLTEKWPNAFQDCLVNIPLIVKLPNIKQKKHINHELIQSIDIFPTIMEIARIKTPYTHFGKSIIPLLKGEKQKHREMVFAEGGYNLREPQSFEPPVSSQTMALMGIYYDKTNIPQDIPSTVARSVMIRTKNHKLILRAAGKEELYDLRNDPNELQNLFYNEKYRALKNELKEKILYWYLNTSDNPHWGKTRNI